MARGSRKRYARASSMRSRRRQGAATWFRLSVAVVVVLGTAVVVQSRNQRASVALPGASTKDHWHAAIGVNFCGNWQKPIPLYEGNDGVHAHGDGLMHIHPFNESGAHQNANVGKFVSGATKLLNPSAKYSVSSTSITWANKTYKNGDKCGKKEGKVRWVVNTKEKTGSGNPANFSPKNGDRIVLAFVPADFPFDQIKEPDTKSALNNISDLGSTTTVPAATSSTAPGETTTTAAGATTTTGAGATTTTAKP